MLIFAWAIFLVVAALISFCCIILFTKTTLIISVGKGGMLLKISKLNFSHTFSLDKKQEEKDVHKADKDIEKEDRILKKFFDVRNTFMRQKNAVSEGLSYLKGRISLDEVGIIGKFGTGDPATGGTVYGSIYAFANTLVAFSGQFFEVKKEPLINIKFQHNEAVFEMKAAFMFKAKPFDILKAFIIYKKVLKKG